MSELAAPTLELCQRTALTVNSVLAALDSDPSAAGRFTGRYLACAIQMKGLRASNATELSSHWMSFVNESRWCGYIQWEDQSSIEVLTKPASLKGYEPTRIRSAELFMWTNNSVLTALRLLQVTQGWLLTRVERQTIKAPCLTGWQPALTDQLTQSSAVPGVASWVYQRIWLPVPAGTEPAGAMRQAGYFLAGLNEPQ